MATPPDEQGFTSRYPFLAEYEGLSTFGVCNALAERITTLERKWQEDHETLYRLLHQRIAELEQLVTQHEAKRQADYLRMKAEYPKPVE